MAANGGERVPRNRQSSKKLSNLRKSQVEESSSTSSEAPPLPRKLPPTTREYTTPHYPEHPLPDYPAYTAEDYAEYRAVTRASETLVPGPRASDIPVTGPHVRRLANPQMAVIGGKIENPRRASKMNKKDNRIPSKPKKVDSSSNTVHGRKRINLVAGPSHDARAPSEPVARPDYHSSASAEAVSIEANDFDIIQVTVDQEEQNDLNLNRRHVGAEEKSTSYSKNLEGNLFGTSYHRAWPRVQRATQTSKNTDA